MPPEILLLLLFVFYFAIAFLFARAVSVRRGNDESEIIVRRILFGNNFFHRRKIKKIFRKRSNAAKKLGEFAKQLNISIDFAELVGLTGKAILLTNGEKLIFLDISYLSRNTNGLFEISFAHEIGHCLIWEEEPLKEFCEHKKIHCELLKEKMAWEKAFELLKRLGIKVDENAFWMRARICFATYVKDFFKKDCREIADLNCPKISEFYASPIFKEEISENDLKKYLLEIPEENIIIE